MADTEVERRSAPADPAYAWIMLPVAVLMQAGTAPGQTFGVSLFNEPIRAELGLSHTALTGAYLAASALAALPLMGIGRLMDRFGMRRVALGLILLVGLACLGISRVENLLGLTVAFFALRAFAQGGLSMTAANTLGMWFSRRLGFASGLAGVGMSATVAVAPLGFLALIERFGWRDAYATIGLIVLATLLPLVALVYRNNHRAVSAAADHDDAARSFTLREAIRTPAYWVAAASTALTGAICTALFFNLTPLFQANGFTAEQAAGVFPVSAAAMAVMQLKGGLLADRAPLRVLMGAAMVSLAASAWLLGTAESLAVAYLGAAAIGANQGLLQVTGNTLWPRYFGRRNLGQIRSSVWTAMVAGCSVGPFVMGATYDRLGSYDVSVWLFVALAGAASLAAVRYGAPPERPAVSESPGVVKVEPELAPAG